MRRIIGAGAVLALAGALMLGTFQATAAAPYVYACSQVSDYMPTPENTNVTIYNGTATTANITFKALAFDGINLNSSLSLQTTFTVAPTRTRWTGWFYAANHDASGDDTVPSTVRIVSDQPVEVFVNPTYSTGANIYPCLQQQP
jgi:hypothetical protein